MIANKRWTHREAIEAVGYDINLGFEDEFLEMRMHEGENKCRTL